MNNVCSSRLTIAVFLLFAVLSLEAQHSCGTVVSPDYIQKEKELQKKMLLKAFTSQYPDKINRSFEITAYVLTQDSGVIKLMTDSIDKINKAFEPIGMSFKICRYIFPRDSAYTISDEVTRKETDALYNTPRTINMFFVNGLISGGTDACGMAYMTWTEDYNSIYIKCIETVTIIHELGHFFGLYHPHDTKYFGSELADSSNCATTGDLICDTPADPNLLTMTGPGCTYTGNVRDYKGHSYVPQIGNFMAYSSGCGCFFTPGQYQKMVLHYYVYKSYLR